MPRSERQGGGRARGLRPKLAGNHRARPPEPHQHPHRMPSPGRPRIGPAPTGPTTTLPLRSWGVSMNTSVPVGVGGSGMRSQARFAAAQAVERRSGVDEARWAGLGACPRAWAEERIPGPPAARQRRQDQGPQRAESGPCGPHGLMRFNATPHEAVRAGGSPAKPPAPARRPRSPGRASGRRHRRPPSPPGWARRSARQRRCS